MVPPPLNPYTKTNKSSTSNSRSRGNDDVPGRGGGGGGERNNPYANATKESSASATSSSSLAGDRMSSRKQHLMPSLPQTIKPVTFSQAFGDEILPSEKTKNDNAIIGTDATVDTTHTYQPQDAQHNMEDRDHHILLQPHVLYVSTKQRGNEVLKHIRNVPMAYSKMVPDYIMSGTTCALFLSIKYHQLYPRYIHRRIGELRTDFRLRILLVLVDVEDNAKVLAFLNKLAVTHNMTLILSWSEQEAARYLETYKALDGKDASSIQKRESTNFQDQTTDFLTACKPVNKTDASNLLHHFSTIRALVAASPDELALCEGVGPIKVKRLYEALHKPFSKLKARERRRERTTQGKESLDPDSNAQGKGT